ncbi:MAG: hypothetical protein IRA32_09155, partial [Xanthomonas citri pv. citri]
NDGGNASHACTDPQQRLAEKRSDGGGVTHACKRHHRDEACQALREWAGARARRMEQKTLPLRDLSTERASN